MITAKEAKELCNALEADHQLAMEYANKRIRERAITGERSSVIRGKGWERQPGMSDEQSKLLWMNRKKLESLGFKVKDYYRDGNQFSDYGTLVEW